MAVEIGSTKKNILLTVAENLNNFNVLKLYFQ